MLGNDTAVSGREGNSITNSHNDKINPRSSTPPPVPIPLQHPPRAQHFTGRKEALNKLLNDLKPRSVVTLCGAGGMGKTALAAEAVAYLIGENNSPPARFPHGVIFYSFYNNPSVDVALMMIAQMFKVDREGTVDQQAAMALNAKTVLLVLDGAEDADDLPRVLAVARSCGVLVTSRDKQDAGACRQDMQSLPEDEAVALLGKWAEAQIDDDEVAKKICDRIGGLPLAVRLVGRYLSETNDSTSDYLQWLEENPLEALDPDDNEHRHQSVRVLLARSVQQLNKEGRQVLAILGCLAMKPVPLFVLMGVLDLSKVEVRKIINPLINLGVLQQSQADQYEVAHALIHTKEFF